jgi:hypothetical protein
MCHYRFEEYNLYLAFASKFYENRSYVSCIPVVYQKIYECNPIDHLAQIPILLVGFPSTVVARSILTSAPWPPYIHYRKEGTRLEVCLVFKWTVLISICQQRQRLGKG